MKRFGILAVMFMMAMGLAAVAQEKPAATSSTKSTTTKKKSTKPGPAKEADRDAMDGTAMDHSKMDMGGNDDAMKSMMAMSKPAPEMQKAIKMFAGTWTTVEKHEPNQFMPKGGTGHGTDTARPGPGGLSLIAEYRSKGPMGNFVGHQVFWWDPQKNVFHSFWTDSTHPSGDISDCSWQGDDLVCTGTMEMMGKSMSVKGTITDIKPNSYTYNEESTMEGGDGKMMMTIHYTKTGGGAAAKAPAKPSGKE